MKRIQSTVGAIALLACAWPTFAQTDKDKDKDKPKSQTTAVAAATDTCFVHKAGDILGADVRNPQDENLGKIDELVINPETGDIEYAVLSFGGFMGMGDKLFALPWDVLEPAHKGDSDKKFFLLHVDKERLKTSPGFPKDNWPDMNSPEWAKNIRDFYAKDLRSDSASADKAIDASKRYNLVKASDLKGCDVDTSDGKDAGEVHELAIDQGRGRIAYFVLASGGFLGFGKDKYVIPWQAATVSVGEDKKLTCKLHVPKAKFEKAPDFVAEDWKRMSDPVFVREVYTYYGTPVYWKDSDLIEAGSKRMDEEKNP